MDINYSKNIFIFFPLPRIRRKNEVKPEYKYEAIKKD
jgi:hypothetical protein